MMTAMFCSLWSIAALHARGSVLECSLISQATAMKLQQEKHDREVELEDAKALREDEARGAIVREHWATYGRNYYSRYDYETVDSGAAVDRQ